MIPEHRPGPTECPYLTAGHCYWCCDTCNLDNHRCHFCGEDLDHHSRLPGGTPNPCYAEN